MVLISDSEERLLKLALLVVYQRSTALYVIHVHMTNPCCPRHTHNNISRRLRYHKGAMGCGCMGCGCMGCGCMGCGCMGCGCMGLAWALHGPCMGLAWAYRRRQSAEKLEFENSETTNKFITTNSRTFTAELTRSLSFPTSDLWIVVAVGTSSCSGSLNLGSKQHKCQQRFQKRLRS
jgi:hypothetical protein